MVLTGVILCGILYVAIVLREQTIAERKPLSLDRLDELAGRMARPLAVQTEQTEARAESSAAAEVSVRAPLPKRLERVPTPEILLKTFANQGHENAIAGDAELLKAFEGVLRLIGAAQGSTSQVGEMLMRAGKWDDARRYFYQALDESPNRFIFSKVCGRLAWLEEDPERAARLLKLSIDEARVSSRIGPQKNGRAGNGATPDMWDRMLRERLSNAVELCRVTGSEALANHYLERLRLCDPEAALRFDGESPRGES